jgi:hypothetical protein
VLSTGQRGHIYQLVQRWGQARIEREGVSGSLAFASIWATLKARYNVARYEHIPARQYADCVQFISRNYQQLTGEALDITAAEEPDGPAQ